MVAHSVPHHARNAGNSTPLQWTARVGYAVSGLLHLLIGWIAVQIAVGDGGAAADQSGALRQLASAPGGRALLWFGVVGLAALGLWQLAEAAFGPQHQDSSKQAARKAKAAAKGVVYLFLAFTTFQFARGGGTSSGQQSSDFTARLLQSGAGKALLVAIGLVLLAVGAYHVYKGWKHKFLEDLQSAGGGIGSAVRRLGTVGYIAKGIALGVVGALLVAAAVTSDPSEATGLDGALRTLQEQPAGTALLFAVGLGLAAYGIYSFARARYARM